MGHTNITPTSKCGGLNSFSVARHLMSDGSEDDAIQNRLKPKQLVETNPHIWCRCHGLQWQPSYSNPTYLCGIWGISCNVLQCWFFFSILSCHISHQQFFETNRHFGFVSLCLVQQLFSNKAPLEFSFWKRFQRLSSWHAFSNTCPH